MDLVTTTGIKGKVFSPRRPNSYWMQSFCVIMLMLISGHSNLLKILKSRQSKKMKRTLVGLFWRLIQPAGSSSLIICLLTWPPSSCRAPPQQSPPPPPCHPGSPSRQGPLVNMYERKSVSRSLRNTSAQNKENTVLLGRLWAEQVDTLLLLDVDHLHHTSRFCRCLWLFLSWSCEVSSLLCSIFGKVKSISSTTSSLLSLVSSL